MQPSGASPGVSNTLTAPIRALVAARVLTGITKHFLATRKPGGFVDRRVGMSIRSARSAYVPLYHEACSDFIIATKMVEQACAPFMNERGLL